MDTLAHVGFVVRISLFHNNTAFEPNENHVTERIIITTTDYYMFSNMFVVYKRATN